MRASSRSDFSSLSSWKKASWPLARTASSTSSRSSFARRSRLRPPTGAPFSRLRRRSRSGGVTLSLGSYRTAIFSFPATSPLLELASLQVVHRQRGGEHRRFDQLLRLAPRGDLQVQLACAARHLLYQLLRQGAAGSPPVGGTCPPAPAPGRAWARRGPARAPCDRRTRACAARASLRTCASSSSAG